MKHPSEKRKEETIVEMHKEASFRPWPMRSETKIGTYDSPKKMSKGEFLLSWKLHAFFLH